MGAVVHRTREIGIRMALGADAEGVLRLVMGRRLLPALSGIAAGLAIVVAPSGAAGGLVRPERLVLTRPPDTRLAMLDGASRAACHKEPLGM